MSKRSKQLDNKRRKTRRQRRAEEGWMRAQEEALLQLEERQAEMEHQLSILYVIGQKIQELQEAALEGLVKNRTLRLKIKKELEQKNNKNS